MNGGEIFFRLRISAEEYLRYYRGTATFVQVRAEDGRRIRLPASSLRRFVMRGGIEGRFRLRFDGHQKIISLEKVNS
ncbi:Protein of unknown function [Geoalkalibacter ferrihydriticus]|uniref:Topoisomerase II n=2 Tax=Geoalkalibacter ferrihydriticus TaxID=392333 RepID=A0A0C2DVJ5_9BACT|nr:DUF2835 domain-containing protein [Geoalkalibacter ferrihydriticus]KIH77464.1 hypothetical protein GFER_01680 [Geoalkalibacter ferrihydriticus DSM 17813]SDM13988.1 Protein of unknown function [Geoalkalibacter ferrihydriticus]